MGSSDVTEFAGKTSGSAQTAPATIVLIDDDFEMVSMLSSYLSGEGFAVRHAPTGTAGLQIVNNEVVSLVLLDVVLSDLDGFEVLRRLRLRSRVPVIMLTMQGAVIERVRGFEGGADDYVPKPFAPVEVLARIRSLLRRSQFVTQEPLRLFTDDLVIIPTSRTVLKEGQVVCCTTSEFDVLYSLAFSAGNVVTKEELTRSALGRCSYSGDRGVDNLVHSLRKKLGPRIDGGERFKAVRSTGYVYLRSTQTVSEEGMR